MLTRRQVLFGTIATPLVWCPPPPGDRPRDILLVLFDDLNDWAGVLGGHPRAHTPNLDRLGREGLVFVNAHCAVPACHASRTALLTGLSPHTTGVYSNDDPFLEAWPDHVTLPEHLGRNGYHTVSCGKVFHEANDAAWNVAWKRPTDRRGPLQSLDTEAPPLRCAAAELPASDLHDAIVAEQAIRELKSGGADPRFLACGSYRPHLPWVAPREWFDLVGPNPPLPVAPPGDLDDVPAAGRRMARVAVHDAVVRSGAWEDLVRAYLASVAFADAQLGRVLAALDASGRAKRTAVIVTSDHGYALGQKQHWGKFALWEECTRVPLVARVPGLTTPGSRCARPVGLVDLTPTLTSLAGVRGPRMHPTDAWDGRSFQALMSQPGLPWSRPALTTMGAYNHALRDERWRYIRYEDGSEELYDHATDAGERHNLASDPATAEVRRHFAAQLPVACVPPNRVVSG